MLDRLDFYAQHHQFYIADKFFEGDTSDDSFWTENAVNSRLAIGSGILGVSLGCYGPVKGELVVLNNENENYNAATWDHIVEGPIFLVSGILQILNCPNTDVELEKTIILGQYGVRIYSANLRSVIGDEGDDFYRIELWPALKIDRKVLKQFLW